MRGNSAMAGKGVARRGEVTSGILPALADNRSIGHLATTLSPHSEPYAKERHTGA
jgi:hypothetical protein